MRVLVNSDNTIAVDASLTRFVAGEVRRVLSRFDGQLTRIEVHLSDINNLRTGKPDKRCLIEARPNAGAPRTASATTTKVASSVSQALGKMRRSLTTFFGRRRRQALVAATQLATARKTAATARTAVTKQSKLSARGPKKTPIYQARRKKTLTFAAH
jgi:hypothetical protein